ncbi:MAG: Fe-Mn family superoxide dismutase [Patescibacteria group bacterium]
MYKAKNFRHLLGIKGLSDKLLENHFILYEGYVKNFNKLNDILVTFEKADKYETPEYAELNRRFGWEFNGMRLHELYFENLTKTPIALENNSALFLAIKKEFGSLLSWEKDFRAMVLMRGIGWVVLYYDKKADRLFNIWINEHDVGHLAGCEPILVLDVFEHAYLLDYGIKKAAYLEAIFPQLNWQKAEKRFAT